MRALTAKGNANIMLMGVGGCAHMHCSLMSVSSQYAEHRYTAPDAFVSLWHSAPCCFLVSTAAVVLRCNAFCLGLSGSNFIAKEPLVTSE